MKTGKKILSLVLVAIFVVSVLPLAYATGDTSVEFEGGTGTVWDPYKVATPEQLNAVRYDLSACYEQIADIDMSSWGNWEPIGKGSTLSGSTGIEDLPEVENKPFVGTYDGKNYKIIGLQIHDNSISFTNDCFGLFSSVSSASIKNVNLTNIDYVIDKSTTDYVQLWEKYGATYAVVAGGIVGKATESSINNCTVSGSINVRYCNDATVGGIVGRGNNISECVNKSNVYVYANRNRRYTTADSTVHCGGIVGHSDSVNGKILLSVNYGDVEASAGDFAYVGGISGEYGQIENCLNFADISGETISYNSYSSFAGNSNVGGIVGATSSDYTRYSVNYGNISSRCIYKASSYAGGIVGFCGYYNSGNVYGCYNIGTSILSKGLDRYQNIVDGNVGRIAGYSSRRFSDCYSCDNTLTNGEYLVGLDTDKNGGSYTTEQLLIEDSYIDFDFDNTWKIDSKIGGAVLQSYNSEGENIYNLGEETYSFENFSDSDSNGHCFGMSVTSSGYYIGSLDKSIIGSNYEVALYSFDETDIVKAPICHYHAIQGPGAEQNSMVAGGSIDLIGEIDTASDWNECVDYVKNHRFDNSGSLQIGMWYDGGNGGHAVNFLYYDNINGQDRIYAYDNNFPDIETYYYWGNDGLIHQAPEQTSPVGIIGLDLMDVQNFFSLADEFELKRHIYSNKNEISIAKATAYNMKGTTELGVPVMFKISSDIETVTITPLVDNATFTYMGQKYSFGEIDEDTCAEFTLSASEDDVPEFKIINAPKDTPSDPTDNCSCNCHAGGIKAFFFKILNFFQKLFGKNKVCACGVKH